MTPYSSSRASHNAAIIAVMDFSPTTLAKRAFLVNRNLEETISASNIQLQTATGRQVIFKRIMDFNQSDTEEHTLEKFKSRYNNLIYKRAFENTVCKILSILFRPQCMDSLDSGCLLVDLFGFVTEVDLQQQLEKHESAGQVAANLLCPTPVTDCAPEPDHTCSMADMER